MVKRLSATLLILPLLLLPSCSTFTGGVDFGFGKIPTILLFIIACAFAYWYLFKRH